MPWLRVDDGFTENHKIAALTDREFRVWARVLCYAARNHERKGHLAAGTLSEIVSITTRIVNKFVSLGLLDPDSERGGYTVHDWAVYNPRDPTNSARQQRWREAHRNDPVTAEITDGVTENVTPRPVPSRSTNTVRQSEPTPSSTDRQTDQLEPLGKILRRALETNQ